MGSKKLTMGQVVESLLSVPGSKKQGLWGKERVACCKDVSLGHMPHALSCKEKRGKQPLLLSL